MFEDSGGTYIRLEARQQRLNARMSEDLNEIIEPVKPLWHRYRLPIGLAVALLALVTTLLRFMSFGHEPEKPNASQPPEGHADGGSACPNGYTVVGQLIDSRTKEKLSGVEVRIENAGTASVDEEVENGMFAIDRVFLGSTHQISILVFKDGKQFGSATYLTASRPATNDCAIDVGVVRIHGAQGPQVSQPPTAPLLKFAGRINGANARKLEDALSGALLRSATVRFDVSGQPYRVAPDKSLFRVDECYVQVFVNDVLCSEVRQRSIPRSVPSGTSEQRAEEYLTSRLNEIVSDQADQIATRIRGCV